MSPTLSFLAPLILSFCFARVHQHTHLIRHISFLSGWIPNPFLGIQAGTDDDSWTKKTSRAVPRIWFHFRIHNSYSLLTICLQSISVHQTYTRVGHGHEHGHTTITLFKIEKREDRTIYEAGFCFLYLRAVEIHSVLIESVTGCIVPVEIHYSKYRNRYSDKGSHLSTDRVSDWGV